MSKEEIEELKDFTIDLNDIDELALGLEVCSKKSNMVIQEFANLIIELEQQNKKYKEVIDKLLNQEKEFISYLENEKDRLSRECSQIYEDSLGKTRLVNEDIFNEVNDILQKYKGIIGVSDEKNN